MSFLGKFLSAAPLVALLLLVSLGSASGGTTGQISGTVTDSANGAPLSAVAVKATSPTGNYSATTNAQGFYVMTGVIPDTLVLTFSKSGYDLASIPGVTVIPDQTVAVSAKLTKTAKTIGQVSVRGAASAFQPSQTVNTYTVTSKQIESILGKKDNVSETQLILGFPGAALSQAGAITLRGGRRNEIGFQFEGVDYTDAETSQFVNSLALNGIDQAQLTPGSGDASQGNSGTGVINLVLKRGAYPPSGRLDFEANVYPYLHQFGAQYGFATPDGKFSDFASYIGSRSESQSGARGDDAARIGAFYSTNNTESNDLVDNLVYRFGNNQANQFQFVYQNQAVHFGFNRGGWTTLCYKTCDPFALATFNSLYGLSAAQVQRVTGLFPGQTAAVQNTRQSGQVQPNETVKLQLSRNIDSATYFQLRYYKVNAVVRFDQPNAGTGTGSLYQDQGSLRAGTSGELTKQLNDKNLAQLGFKYEFAHGDIDGISNTQGLGAVSGDSKGYEVADFLPPPGSSGFIGCPSRPGVTVKCGYLFGFFPNGPPRLPLRDRIVPVDAQYWALFAQDTYSPSDRLRVLAGLRLDGANVLLPYAGAPAEVQHPRVLEPHFAFTYRASPIDSIRFSYGRTLEFAFLARYTQGIQNRAFLAPFVGIPSWDNRTQAAAAFCGQDGNLPCADYAEQLFWEYQNGEIGKIVQPVRPETFNNYDLSYAHQFPNNLAVKITPFFRRGYDVLTLTNTIRAINPLTGTPIFNPRQFGNDGTNKTTGVEFLLTKDAAYGLSGQLSATYVNELSNVPPLIASEDIFPVIPAASLALGNIYRVGYLSPFQAQLSANYKTRNGWRINPIITYNKGYPLNIGSVTAVFINGLPYNVPSTNLTNPNGPAGSSLYVDPQNPGSLFNPIVAAARGTPETSSPGGILSSARMSTNMTIEYSPPRGGATYGVQITNLFNQLYSLPSANTLYQPVAPGIAGPLTGISNNAKTFPGLGFTSFGPDQHGQSPYLIRPNNTPITFRVYYQQKL